MINQTLIPKFVSLSLLLVCIVCFNPRNISAQPITFRSYSLFLGQGVSDNIDQDPEGQEDADLISTAGAGVTLGRVGTNYTISASYNLFYQFIWKDREESGFVHNLDFNLNTAFQRPIQISPKATLGFNVTDTLRLQPINSRGTESLDNTTTVNTASGAAILTYAFTPLTTASTVFSAIRQDPFSGRREGFYSFGFSEVISHTFASNPRLSVSVSPLVDFRGSNRFEERFSLGGLVSFTYLLSPLTQVGAGIGYSKVYLLDSDGSTQGIIGQASISHIFSPRTSGFISYNRNFSTDIDMGDEFLSDSVVGTLTHLFLEDVSSSLSAYFQRRDFRESDLNNEHLYGGQGTLSKPLSDRLYGSLSAFFGVFDFFDRQDESLRGTAVLSYQLATNWFLSVDYSHIRRFSEDSDLEFTENIGFISLRWTSGPIPGIPFFSFSEIKAPLPLTPVNPSIPAPHQAPSPFGLQPSPLPLPSPQPGVIPPSEPQVPPSEEEGI